MERSADLTLREGIEVFQRRWPSVRSNSTESPIVLMASGYRTGSTLLQRMLSKTCLMWGEPYGHGGLLDSVPDVLRRIRNFWPEDTFFYEGEDSATRASTFIANLYPSPQRLLDSYVDFFSSLFAQPSQESGIHRWGIKTVRCSADHAHFLRWVFPHAKFLFLVRNPYHAFQSYSTIRRQRHVIWFNRWPDRPLNVREFGRHWRVLTASFLREHQLLQAPMLFYEDIVAGRCDFTALEHDLGIRIDRDALSVNPGGWPEPDPEVSEQELAILRAEVEPLAEQLGYSPPKEFDRTAPAVANRRDEEPGRALQRAMAAYQKGDSTEADRQCQEILRNCPDFPGAWHLFGLLRLAEQDYSSALDSISRAIAVCDIKPVYHNNQGAVLLELARHNEAEGAFRRAIALNQDYADAWSNLGHVQLLTKAPREDAEKSLLRALALQPGHRDALMHLADLYRENSRFDDAARLLQQWIDRYGDHPRACKNLGQTLGQLGRYDGAKAAFERAIALSPEDDELYLCVGSLEAAWEKLREAKQAFQHAASLRPDRAICGWKHLGSCPTVFPSRDALDQYWEYLDQELTVALNARPSADWRSLPQDGFTPPFNLPHHHRCCRDAKEKFTELFRGALPEQSLVGNTWHQRRWLCRLLPVQPVNGNDTGRR